MSERAHEIIGIGPVSLRWEPDARLDELAERHAAKINRAWEQARAAGPARLVDGTLLTLREARQTPEGVLATGSFVAYRMLVADRHIPRLGLDIKPVGISALTVVTESGEAIVARRAGDTHEHPGSWELVPSGSIDCSSAAEDGSVDHRTPLLTELWEEAALSESAVAGVSELGLVLDRTTGTYDVCARIELAASRDDVLATLRHSREYSDARLMKPQELRAFLETAQSAVPTSVALLEIFDRTKGPDPPSAVS